MSDTPLSSRDLSEAQRQTIDALTRGMDIEMYVEIRERRKDAAVVVDLIGTDDPGAGDTYIMGSLTIRYDGRLC